MLRFRIQAGAGALTVAAASTILRAGVCSAGTSYALADGDPGQDPVPAIGYGPLSAVASQASRLSGAKQVLLKIPATTAGTIGAVTKSPSNATPLITIAGSDFDSVTNSPFDAFKVRVKVNTGGPVGVAVIDVALDGSSYDYTFQVPPEGKAVLDGVTDLAALTYPYAGLDTKHIDFTAPSAATITFSGSFASFQKIADQFNESAAAVPTKGSLTSSAGSFPVALVHGETFLAKVDQQGSADTLTISATAASKTGSGATYAAVTAGHSLTLTIAGDPFVVVFTGSENDQASFHATVNAVIAGHGLATNSAGQTKISTAQKGTGAAGSVDAGDADVLASLGLSVGAFTTGTGNVANVAAVTAAELAALFEATFTGGTAGSSATANANGSITWETNTPGASPKGVKLTGGTGVSKIAGFDNAEHNGTAGADLAVRMEIVEDSAGHAYPRLYTLAGGESAELTIDAGASDAESVLGYTAGDDNLTATGSPSKLVLPGTGLELTFPSSADYIKGTIESFDTTAPLHSLGDLDTGLAAANADVSIQWGLVEVVQDPSTPGALRSYVEALDADVAGWEAQEDKRFTPYIIGATIDATDQAIKDAMSGHQSRYGSVAAGDLFLTAAGSSPKGKFRRSACRALGVRLASIPLSEDPGYGGFGSLPEASMKGPAGEAARNESTASVKLGTSKGPGFTVVKAKGGLPYFVRGVTRAGQSSIFVDIGVQRMAAYAATAIFALLRRIENPTFDLNEDGTLQEADAAALEASFETELKRLLVQAKHASAVQVTIDRAEKVSQTRNITCTYTIQIRGQAEDITGVETLVSELSIPGQLAQAA